MAKLTEQQQITRLNSKIIKLNKEIEILNEIISDNELNSDITIIKRENESLKQLLEEKEVDFQENCDSLATIQAEVNAGNENLAKCEKSLEDLNQLILDKEKVNQQLDLKLFDANEKIKLLEHFRDENTKIMDKIKKSFWYKFIKI